MLKLALVSAVSKCVWEMLSVSLGNVISDRNMLESSCGTSVAQGERQQIERDGACWVAKCCGGQGMNEASGLACLQGWEGYLLSRVRCYNPITWEAEVVESRVKASLGYR